ncbi:arginyltransferase [Malassezia nana]|uniref:Arginyltransferase n=1 Tax=Malassezia nana TaxID=180528 RepID=A0AAF0J2L3_9BASI|nr:arginyltransferase [Malassezia nana]
MSVAQPLGYHGSSVPLAACRPNKSQKRALRHLYWTLSGQQPPSRWKGKWGDQGPYSLQQRLSLVLQMDEEPPPMSAPYDTPVSDKIQVSLRQASSTDEKYALFRRYQATIHGEAPADISDRAGWASFLVDAPFPSRSEDASPFGLYHHEYRYHGRLIGVGVLDILPHCVSSVYFFYDPAYSSWQLGKISALCELALGQTLSQTITRLEWYYMGFYIDSCPKMRYKGEFRPSDLLDTSDNRWHALERVLPQLRAGQRAYWGTSVPASGPWPMPSSLSDTDGTLPDPLPLGYDTPEAVRTQSDQCASTLATHTLSAKFLLSPENEYYICPGHITQSSILEVVRAGAEAQARAMAGGGLLAVPASKENDNPTMTPIFLFFPTRPAFFPTSTHDLPTLF